MRERTGGVGVWNRLQTAVSRVRYTFVRNKMYRAALRVTGTAIRPCLSNVTTAGRRFSASTIHFNSSQPPKTEWTDKQARRATLEKIDDLQRDWDARILKYEELKPKTQSPTPVRF
jgi:hypothetical protein